MKLNPGDRGVAKTGFIENTKEALSERVNFNRLVLNIVLAEEIGGSLERLR